MVPTLALTLLLAITPKECSSKPEWCTCRQYVESENNKCLWKADILCVDDRRELRAEQQQCEEKRRAGIRACELDDGDIYEYGEDAGKD
jgi:hypothetical protein